MKRKILYVTGTRADYGLMHSILSSIHQHPLLSLEIAVTGMHLMAEFGTTVNEIKRDDFPYFIIDATIESDSKKAMAEFIGVLIQKGTREIKNHDPDIILILGDRVEMLGAAVIGAYLGIPVAHIHGGEITSTVDDIARHAITKLSNIHFPATRESAERIIRMGEDPSRVYITGAPGLDLIQSEELIPPEKIKKRYRIPARKKFLLILQHPVTVEEDIAGEQMRETLEAVIHLNMPAIVIYPNADAGGQKMIAMIRMYESYPHFRIYKNIPHKDFLSLLRSSAAIVGNSSCGMIEAASFNTPVVNIGTRQNGRQRGCNVIDTGYNRNEISTAVKKAISNKAFLKKIKQGYNPYKNGTCAETIVNVLSTIPIDATLIQKRMNY